ncbi:hypothetical protein MT325_M570L [Paramecium bursaria chlorella virus MT325]|uniref:Uncharacterized protein M570L n=1 Tax=Paramecium bursaria Chlorella virus MT325 TaxID=346932 RepID=A7IUV1_PBCVM|nr:hypothetical protein MT325_M570L [Paramecium bursaria chlorella virus MT325]
MFCECRYTSSTLPERKTRLAGQTPPGCFFLLLPGDPLPRSQGRQSELLPWQQIHCQTSRLRAQTRTWQACHTWCVCRP